MNSGTLQYHTLTAQPCDLHYLIVFVACILIELAVVSFVMCYVNSLHNIQRNRALTEESVVIYSSSKIFDIHTPYSKMAANKLFFCLHVH